MIAIVRASPCRSAHHPWCAVPRAIPARDYRKGYCMSKRGLIAVAILAILLCLAGTCAGMYLSLDHLAETIQTFSGADHTKAYSLAITIDILLVGAEVALIVFLALEGRDWIYAIGLFILCAGLSIAMNAWAFVSHHPDIPGAFYFALSMGIVLPLAICLACLITSRLLQLAILGEGKLRHKLPEEPEALLEVPSDEELQQMSARKRKLLKRTAHQFLTEFSQKERALGLAKGADRESELQAA